MDVSLTILLDEAVDAVRMFGTEQGAKRKPTEMVLRKGELNLSC
jgi:hypothetical protein